MIFLFEQKTSYDMLISAWSSDVCSSDLGVHLVEDRPQRVLGHAGNERRPHRTDGFLADRDRGLQAGDLFGLLDAAREFHDLLAVAYLDAERPQGGEDRKSTRLNSSH